MNEFRHSYNANISKLYLIGLYAHLPIFAFMAWYFQTQWWVALGLSAAILTLPTYRWFKDKGDVVNLYLIAISYIMFSGILIHLGKGMIEMHFHIFVSIAVLSVFGYRGPVLAASTTAALHHVGFWLFLPESVFNYQASFPILVVHALFVVIETIPALYIAKKFYDFIDMQGEVLTELESLSGELDKLSTENKQDAEKLGFVSSNLTQSCSQQAEAVQETVAALAEINAMINMAGKHVENSHQMIGEGKEVSNLGQRDLKSLNQGLQETERSIEQLEDIKNIVEQIKQKASVINDIVFQTKLLSFNASVEAARAGQHGRGFAVVAEEVGKLAESSGKASQEIESLLKDSDHKVSSIVEAIKESVNNGNTLTQKVVTNFMSFNEKFVQVEGSIDSITTANEENTKGILEVTSAMDQLNIVTINNEKEAETLSTYANSISSRGQTLFDLVKKIKTQIEAVRAVGEKKQDEDAQEHHDDHDQSQATVAKDHGFKEAS